LPNSSVALPAASRVTASIRSGVIACSAAECSKLARLCVGSAVRALATEIATQCSPLGVAHAKRHVYSHLFTDLATALKDEDESVAVMAGSEDFKEGVRAFLEKRAPKFPGK